MSYLDLTIQQMHQALVEGLVTSEQLVKEAILRIKNDKTNSFEALALDQALEEAKKVTSVGEEEILKGIPFLAKDNYSTKGIETTASSDVLSGYVPIFDAEVITRLKNAGAILLGKTTLDELAMGGTGTTGHKGVTTNPYDNSRIIGGSSCGSCASVASGIVPFSLGSDTGDSVRKPASYGGIYGFKPTWGRISRFGLFPFACSLDTVAYFARSVYDIAVLTEILAGHDDKDMSSSYKEVENYSSYLRRENDKKKIGYFKPILDAIDDEKIKNSYFKLLDELKNKGYEVNQYDFPEELLDALYPVYMIISCSEATSNDANLDGVKFGLKPSEEAKTWSEYMSDARTRGFSSLIKRRFIIGSFSLLAENQEELFRRAQKARNLIVEEMNKFFLENDYLILPCAKSVPPKVEDVTNKWSKKPDFIDNHLGIANLGGFPSLTCPLGYENGLPYGVNITGRQYQEGYVLKCGQDIEDVTKLVNSLCFNHKEGI